MENFKLRVFDKEIKKMYYNIGISPYEITLYEVTNKLIKPPIIGTIGIDRDNYILMNFTGLKDKNKVDIYEDDIIRVRHRKDIKDLHSFFALVQINGGSPFGYYWEVVDDYVSSNYKYGFCNNKLLQDFMFKFAGELYEDDNVLSGIEVVGNKHERV